MTMWWLVVIWLVIDVGVSVIAWPVSSWVWKEARKDLEAIEAHVKGLLLARLPLTPDIESMVITGHLRRRNTGGIFASQVVYLVSGLLMLMALAVVSQSDERSVRAVAAWVLFASSGGSRLLVKLVLLRLSFASQADRRRIWALFGNGASLVRPTPPSQEPAA